jgi:tetratricopeptide (TPR) repeat protein
MIALLALQVALEAPHAAAQSGPPKGAEVNPQTPTPPESQPQSSPSPPKAPQPPNTSAGVSSAVEASKQHVRRGNALFRVGKIEEALKQYEAAYEIAPEPRTLFNMAQCHRALRNYERAIFLYNSYLNTVGGDAHRSEVESIVIELDRLVQEQKRAAARPPQVLKAPDDLLAPAAPVVAPRDIRRPWYRRWYVWVSLGAIITGAALAGGLAGRGSSTPSTTYGNHDFFAAGGGR